MAGVSVMGTGGRQRLYETERGGSGRPQAVPLSTPLCILETRSPSVADPSWVTRPGVATSMAGPVLVTVIGVRVVGHRPAAPVRRE